MKKYAILFLMGVAFFGIESADGRTRSMSLFINSSLDIKTYEHLKSVFIKSMYDMTSPGLVISFKEFEFLASKFMSDAEASNLVSIKYCKEHPQKQLAHRFLKNIIVYMMLDYDYNQIGIHRSDLTGIDYTKKPSETKLKACLEDIQKEVKEKFDIDAELAVLVQLIQKVNEDFYKAYPWYYRLAIHLCRYLPVSFCELINRFLYDPTKKQNII